MTPGSDRAGWAGGAGVGRRSRLTCRGRAAAVHTRSWQWGRRWLHPYRARWYPALRSESGQKSTGSVTASPQHHRPSPDFIPHYLKYHHAKACQHQQLTQALTPLPQSSWSISQQKTEVSKLKRNRSGKELLDICSVRHAPKASLFFPWGLAASPAGVGGRLQVPSAWRGSRGPPAHPLLKVIRRQLQRPGIRQSTGRLQAIFSSCGCEGSSLTINWKAHEGSARCLPGSIYRSYSELQVTAGCTAGCLNPSS